MPSPRSIRFAPHTLDRLARYADRHVGMSSSSAAALLVEEGLRMDSHPGVVFRTGPAGRRAALASGPDVWEVVRAVQQVREAEPELAGDKVFAAVEEIAGLPTVAVAMAVRYYSEFPGEIDALIAAANTAESELEEQSQLADQLLRG